MRAFALALAISLVLASAAEAAPRRVASLNLCTDELLLVLGAPEQIVSVTHLAQSPLETPYWQAARRYRRNDGTLADVAWLKPDLVLNMGGGARDRVQIAAKLGIQVIDIPYPRSIGDIEASIRQVAAALGRPSAGRKLSSAIAMLKRTVPQRATETVWLGGGGRSVPGVGLASDWMRLAGMRQRSLVGDRISLEQLVVSPPALLLRSDYRLGQYSGEQRWLRHPLAKHVRRSRSLVTDGRRWTCMGPSIIPEILRLRREVVR